MRVELGLVVALSGCSLIYNPGDLPRGSDGQLPDSEDKLDADPALLAITGVSPAELFEGTGTGGSRKGLLTVIGTNLVAGAKIAVVVHAGESGDPRIAIDDAATDVAANGNVVAAPFTLDVNDQLADGAAIRLDVVVTQPGPSGDVVATLTEKTPGADDALLVVRGLDELTGDATPAGTKDYSAVAATTITAAAGPDPVVIRARGGITVTGAVTANAAGRMGGAGGNAGGTGGAVLNPGGAGDGPSGPGTGGKPNGGGGGFGEPGVGASGGPASGNAEITTLDQPNRSSGGAGGDGGAVVSGLQGGDGGGGGGSIELTADGDISIDTIAARGGDGTSGANNGGGGSGGLILLRGAQIAVTSIDIDGGAGQNAGAIGRSRADTAVGAAPTSGFRGPMLDRMTPVITRNDALMLTVFGKPNTSFTYKITSFTGNVSTDLPGSIGPLGTNTFPIGSPLFRGLNTICAFVPGADLTARRREAQNCIEIVYLFTPD